MRCETSDMNPGRRRDARESEMSVNTGGGSVLNSHEWRVPVRQGAGARRTLVEEEWLIVKR